MLAHSTIMRLGANRPSLDEARAIAADRRSPVTLAKP
jgi:hypothetical protein